MTPPPDQTAQPTLDQAKAFYDREYSGEKYMTAEIKKWPDLGDFVREYGLEDSKCLEVGCGRAEHQDLVKDYTGVDLSDTSAKFFKPGKTFRQCSATDLPFADNSFDAAWSIWVIEHVPDPEKAMAEIRRVVRPGGLVFFAPAWQCRSWAAEGYPVRPYSDFDLKGKLIKASVPLRNWIVWRSAFAFPKRFLRAAEMAVFRGPTRFRYDRLKPNFEKYWMPDSDACNRMDPFEAMAWFKSRGDRVLRPGTPLKQVIFRTGHLVIRIQK